MPPIKVSSKLYIDCCVPEPLILKPVEFSRDLRLVRPGGRDSPASPVEHEPGECRYCRNLGFGFNFSSPYSIAWLEQAAMKGNCVIAQWCLAAISVVVRPCKDGVIW